MVGKRVFMVLEQEGFACVPFQANLRRKGLRKCADFSVLSVAMQAGSGSATDTKQGYTLKSEATGQYNTFSLNVATSSAGAFLTLGAGAFVSSELSSYKSRPAEPIILCAPRLLF